jgi:hypothetical protein
LAKGHYLIHSYLQKNEQQCIENRRLVHEKAQLRAQQYAEIRRVAEEKEQQRVEMKRVAHDKALESLLAELEIEEAAAAATAKKTHQK